MPTFTRTEELSLLALAAACVGILVSIFRDGREGEPLAASIAFAGLAFATTFCLIRWLGDAFIKVGFKGRDMSKLKKTEIPETMGVVCAVVYLLAIIIFTPFPFYKYIVAATSGGGNREVVYEVGQEETGRLLHRFPHSKLASYLSAILSLQFMTMLGVGDDLFDIKWRHKVLMPAIAAIPMLIVYYVDFGVTYVVVPVRLQPYLGELIDIGWMYYIYMGMVAVFIPNSINILAGINGLEVSQSLVIAFLLVINDLLYVLPLTSYPHPAMDSHLFSLYLLIPFIGVSLALWWHNWYPAKVFVGDTYCYFAGMVFVVVGILGHFSKTLVILFVPQMLNFIYSAPQLFKLVPCPRHRLPHFNARTGLLEPSKATFVRPPAKPVDWALRLLQRLKLLQLRIEDGVIVESSNFTLINLCLVWWGPMREDRLCMVLVALQMVWGLAALFARHRLALLVFREDNLKMLA